MSPFLVIKDICILCVWDQYVSLPLIISSESERSCMMGVLFLEAERQLSPIQFMRGVNYNRRGYTFMPICKHCCDTTLCLQLAFSLHTFPFTTVKQSNITIRLVPPQSGLDFMGRLEVLHNNVWGTVCDDFFSTAEANVVCGMLNYTDGSLCAVRSAGFGEGEGECRLTRDAAAWCVCVYTLVP